MLNLAQLSRIDLNLLVLFSMVYEEKHVARAAARLNLTPSAVSHGLGRLRQLFNDPLFLRMPRGVIATDRAKELADPIGEIIARVGGVIGGATPFEPSQNRRRFTIGAPDGVSAALLEPLMARLDKAAPGIDIGFVHVTPEHPLKGAIDAWQPAVEMVDSRKLDIAVLPMRQVPPRFVARKLYEEEFVVAMRRGHPFASNPTLSAFCRAEHLLVSVNADPRGLVDGLLAKRGLSRRVALTVPNSWMALTYIAQSDLIASMPRRLVQQNATRFGLITAALPLKRKPDPINAIVSKASLMDAGIAWMMDQLALCTKQRR
jgi:DNA-binding transcriptional LysR family regulator